MDKAQVRKPVNYANVGEAIDHELAAKMVKDFQDTCPSDAVKSYTIGKNVIEQILAQPGCTAIRFFNAIDESGLQTLVYAGVDEKGDNIIEYPVINEKGKLGRIEALIGDRTMGDGTPIKSWFGS
ncbi:MAG: hypothetical protein C5B59_10450 [Bacteroidetes bacterium]|nr:MAG: hypothetical protein C5B59_10450 [Bacteroidota bacterium]